MHFDAVPHHSLISLREAGRSSGGVRVAITRVAEHRLLTNLQFNLQPAIAAKTPALPGVKMHSIHAIRFFITFCQKTYQQHFCASDYEFNDFHQSYESELTLGRGQGYPELCRRCAHASMFVIQVTAPTGQHPNPMGCDHSLQIKLPVTLPCFTGESRCETPRGADGASSDGCSLSPSHL